MDIGRFVSQVGERTQRSERSEAAQGYEGTGSPQLASGEQVLSSQALAGEDLIIQEISIDGICGVY